MLEHNIKNVEAVGLLHNERCCEGDPLPQLLLERFQELVVCPFRAPRWALSSHPHDP